MSDLIGCSHLHPSGFRWCREGMAVRPPESALNHTRLLRTDLDLRPLAGGNLDDETPWRASSVQFDGSICILRACWDIGSS